MRLQILRITSPQNQNQGIEESLEVLKKGGILCLPTDTVYGLAVDAHNEDAVRQVYRLKKRPEGKPLVLFPKEHKVLIFLAKKIPPSALKLISYFWPGPLTLIFQATIIEPRCLISKEGKIGIRIPHHPLPRRISQADGILLATTSANLSGEGAVVEVKKLSSSIKEGVDLILDSGKTSVGRESTVVDVTSPTPQILREGSITSSDLKKVWERPLNILFVCTANMCRSVLAEAIFKTFWPGKTSQKVKVRSAGVSTSFPSPPSKNTIQVLEKKGIDVTSHLSVPVTAGLVKSSDIIFVMEKKHHLYMEKLYPEAQNKIWLLKEFSLGKEEEVSDPSERSEQAYQETARQLEENIGKIVEKMCGK